MTSKKLVVMRDFHQHIAGSKHNDGCDDCYVASFEAGDIYDGKHPEMPLERGLLATKTEVAEAAKVAKAEEAERLMEDET